ARGIVHGGLVTTVEVDRRLPGAEPRVAAARGPLFPEERIDRFQVAAELDAWRLARCGQHFVDVGRFAAAQRLQPGTNKALARLGLSRPWRPVHRLVGRLTHGGSPGIDDAPPWE